jgi:hypothetical protein
LFFFSICSDAIIKNLNRIKTQQSAPKLKYIR